MRTKLIQFSSYFALLILFNFGLSNLCAQNVYSSYFGGSDKEWGEAIAVDNLGYVYIAGHTASGDLPIKLAFDNSGGGFITKLSPNMSEIIYCTYIDGAIYGLSLDKENNLYAVGATSSNSFPHTENAYDTTWNGSDDLLFVKMSPQGELLYGTCFGGSGREKPAAHYLDDSLNLYVTGFTNSTDFPVKSAFSDTYNGGDGGDYGFEGDAFVVKFNMKYNSPIFSTYLGGSENELGFGIAVDKESNVYISGKTPSPNFPVKGGVDISYNGSTDGFITKLSRSGDEIIYSSFIGGSQEDVCGAIAVNDSNEVYFIGGTKSLGLACSENAFYMNKIGGEDLIIGKLNALGTSYEYLSYFGGNKTDFGSWGCPRLHLIDSAKMIIVSNTLSSNMPVTSNSFDNSYSGGNDYGDIFISKLNIVTKENLYTSYIGGSGNEGAHLGVKCLNDSVLYLCSFTSSHDLFTSSDALFTNYLGGITDAFVMKLLVDNRQTTDISIHPEKKNVQIYPTPTDGLINVILDNDLYGQTTFEIWTIEGVKTKDGDFNSSNIIDISDFQRGLYLLVLQIDNDKIVHKIIK